MLCSDYASEDVYETYSSKSCENLIAAFAAGAAERGHCSDACFAESAIEEAAAEDGGRADEYRGDDRQRRDEDGFVCGFHGEDAVDKQDPDDDWHGAWTQPIAATAEASIGEERCGCERSVATSSRVVGKPPPMERSWLCSDVLQEDAWQARLATSVGRIVDAGQTMGLERGGQQLVEESLEDLLGHLWISAPCGAWSVAATH